MPAPRKDGALHTTGAVLGDVDPFPLKEDPANYPAEPRALPYQLPLGFSLACLEF